MTEQEIREIAETAFKDEFPDVKLDRVNVWPGFGFEDDSPVVDVSIIYDGKYEQLNGLGISKVLTEVVSKAFWEVEDDLGFPCVHFFSKPELKRGRRDLATV